MSSTLQRFLPRRQRGQSIVWFLATVAACACVFALVFNVGQVSNRKEETVNAADATALSGAMVQARMLNFMAYTNRATVANEVTIAQMVSLDSWVAYDYELLQWLANYTSVIPYVNSITSALAQGGNAASEGVDAAVQIAVPLLDKMNKYVLKPARDLAANQGAAAAQDIADKVATANSAQLTSTALSKKLNSDAWKGFTKEYDGDGRAEMKEVVLASRDPFSTNRKLGSFFETANYVLAATLHQVHKTSGTTVIDDDYNWAAQDSMDLEDITIGLCGFPPHPCIEETPTIVPVGYGRADANDSDKTGKNLCNESFTILGFDTGPTVNCKLAEENSKHISYSGLSSIRDLQQGLAKGGCGRDHGASGPTLSYVAAVVRLSDPNLTAERLGFQKAALPDPIGSPHMTDDLPGGGKLNEIASVSTACIFFRRPPRDSTAHDIARFDTAESASLYNPYWQVRLSTPDTYFTKKVYEQRGKAGLEAITQ